MHFPEWKGIVFIKISQKFLPKGSINNTPALVQIMVFVLARPANKPFSEPTMISLLTHLCVTRSQWVEIAKTLNAFFMWCSRLFFLIYLLPRDNNCLIWRTFGHIQHYIMPKGQYALLIYELDMKIFAFGESHICILITKIDHVRVCQ